MMKTTFCLIAVCLLAMAPSFGAQESDALKAGKREAAAPGAGKLKSISIPAGSIEDAVTHLQAHLSKDGHEQLNILLKPGVEGWRVPQLNLRHVSGPDALKFIAAAANCEIEPITSSESLEIIGYVLERGSFMDPNTGLPVPRPPQVPLRTIPRRAISRAQSADTDNHGQAAEEESTGPDYEEGAGEDTKQGAKRNPGSGEVSNPLSMKQPAPSFSYGFDGGNPGGSGDGRGLPGGGGGFGGGSVYQYHSMGSMQGAEGKPVTRVYSLAAVVKVTEFTDVEKTLQSTLEIDGLPKDKVKLAYHDETKVLVVNGPERAHQLVEEVLTSLDRNRDVFDQNAALEKSTRLQNELSWAQAEIKNLKHQLEQLRQAQDQAR